MRNFNLLISDTKEFLSDNINRLSILVTLLCIINLCGFYVIEKQLNKCMKVVNFRYFNLTRSLEDIHNVKIDTHDGTLKPIARTVTNTLDK